MSEKPQLTKEELQEKATYEALSELELEFEDIDTEIAAKHAILSRPTFDKLRKLTPKIDNFWALVLEQAPPEIEQFVQPSDQEVFASALQHISVERFEIPKNASLTASGPGAFGEPRSFAITFEFSENEWFSDKSLTKKFYYRRSTDGFSGRISEPVRVHWKKGKDLSEGLTDLACELYDQQMQYVQKNGGKWGVYGEKKNAALPTTELPKFKETCDRVENSTEGAQSFFSWFGYRGKWISDDENKKAIDEEADRRAKVRAGESLSDEDEDDLDEDSMDAAFADSEVFFPGEDVAVAIAEELWPNAIKYFMDAQEEDISEGDFEDMDEDEEMGEDDDDDNDEEVTVEEIRKLVGKNKKGGK